MSPLDQPLRRLIPEVDSPQATGAVTIWRFTGALGSFACGHAELSQHQSHSRWAAQRLGCGPGLQGGRGGAGLGGRGLPGGGASPWLCDPGWVSSAL